MPKKGGANSLKTRRYRPAEQETGTMDKRGVDLRDLRIRRDDGTTAPA
jgi:hypothetical protein